MPTTLNIALALHLVPVVNMFVAVLAGGLQLRLC